MKVLWINYSDYSNLTYGLSESLKSVGIDSECIVLFKHQFSYQKSGTLVTESQMEDKIREADCVVIGHSDKICLALAVGKGKKLFVIHTGTAFRQNPEQYNALFNPVVERVFIDSPEFFSKGCKDVTYVAAAIDSDGMFLSHNQDLVFAHYPSKGSVKGTDKIREMMADFDVRFDCDETIVPHDKNMDRISKCDVYIEMFSTQQDGKEYGSAGVTAWEAAALGRIVITNFLHLDVYEKVYGKAAFIVCNTEEKFRSAIRLLRDCGPMHIEMLQSLSAKWIHDTHSYKATGEYLMPFFVEKK